MQKARFILGLVFCLVAIAFCVYSVIAFLDALGMQDSQSVEALALIVIIPVAMLALIGQIIFSALAIIFNALCFRSENKTIKVVSFCAFALTACALIVTLTFFLILIL